VLAALRGVQLADWLETNAEPPAQYLPKKKPDDEDEVPAQYLPKKKPDDEDEVPVVNPDHGT
jgi:hypothetical protein